MAIVSNFVSILLCESFGNYFSRFIKYYSSLQDYKNNAADYFIRTDINFNPNDQIRTTLNALSLDDEMEEEFDISKIDYLIVYDPSDESVISRWWVMDAERASNGLYNLKLKRDTAAEAIGKPEFISYAPFYVEKGMLKESDPFIVNDEGMSFNQIKRSERLIKESPDIDGFIVGYMTKDATCSFHTTKYDTAPAEYYTLAQIAADTGIAESDLSNMATTHLFFNDKTRFNYFVRGEEASAGAWIYYEILNYIYGDGYIEPFESDGQPIWGSTHQLINLTDIIVNPAVLSEHISALTEYAPNNFVNAVKSIINTDFPSVKFYFENQLNRLMRYNGKPVLIGGKYYYFDLSILSQQKLGKSTRTYAQNTYFKDTFDDALATYNSVYGSLGSTASPNLAGDYEFDIRGSDVTVVLRPYEASEHTDSIPNSHNILIDAPYSMFVIPLGKPKFIDNNTEITWDLERDDALSIANEIATELDAKLYDIQILPYNPCASFFKKFDLSGATIDLDSLTEDEDYSRITHISGGNTITDAVILYPIRSTFTNTILLNDPITKTYSTKIESQVTLYRLVSPNYNGAFDFNIAKTGDINYFIVDCTYKPFNPFIRVSPQFSFLYGSNFLDGRGLICGGDFSLSIVKDAWKDYELRNKNYASIFARDIQNLEFTQKQESIKEILQASLGTVTGVGVGAAAGAKAGGGWGAAIGGAAGLGVGAIGGVADVILGSQRRAEQKDYAIDRFNLSLGNIKALPQSLSRTSVLTIINKIFPFLEYYSATDEEIAALEKKIKYDGMKVGRIDYLSNFISENGDHYFKGKLILSGISANNKIAEDIYEEFAKGVFI